MGELRDVRPTEAIRALLAAGGILHAHYQLAARAVLHGGVDDLRFDLGGNAGPQVGNGGEAGLVLVAQRQVQDEVGLRADAELVELGCSSRSDAGNHPRTSTASISTSAPRGSAATWTVARAG